MSTIPVPEFIQNLTDDELRQELAKNGEKVGPITPTTRNLYKKRLLRKLNATLSLENIEKLAECEQIVIESSKNFDKTTQTIDLLDASETGKANSTATQTETDLGKTPTRTILQKQFIPRNLQKYPVIESTENQEHASPGGTLSSETVKQEDKAVLTTMPITQGGKVENDKLYYGIYIASIKSNPQQNEPIVFENKSTALATLKRHKNARFKEFLSFEKAKEFSLSGDEVFETKTSSSTAETDAAANKYPSLKQEDLNKLIRCIEKGDLPTMLSLVWKNPKYLISSADGPVILKPNARYNALHIAAKNNRARMCRDILQLLSNLDFQSLLFTNSDKKISEHRTKHLIDAYLNTPDKILYETPLHFASKAGYKDVVRELIMFESCSTTMLNKLNKSPLDIACSRASSFMMNDKTEIEQLLTKHYYVPLLRYHDNSESAIIGEPIRSKREYKKFNELSLTLHSNLCVRAFAGPMLKVEAEEFRNNWATPSKRKNLGEKFRYVKRYDCDKGDEQIGRELASRGEFGWTEFWDFIDDFANFSTEDGLQKLEKFLQEKSCPHSNSSTSLDIDNLADLLREVHFSPEQHNDSIEYEPDDMPQSCINGHSDIEKQHDLPESRNLLKPSVFNSCSKQLTNLSTCLVPVRQPVSNSNQGRSGTLELEKERTSQLRISSGHSQPANHPATSPVPVLHSSPTQSSPKSPDKSADGKENNDRTVEMSRHELQNAEQYSATTGSGDVSNVNDKNGDVKVIEAVKSSKSKGKNALKFGSTGSFSLHETPKKNDYVSESSAQKPFGMMSVDNLYFVDSYRCSSETDSEIFSSPSCSTISEVFPLPHNLQVFLTGPCPTKRDQDVVTAIGNIYINPEKFPATFRWRTAVLSFSENVRRKWSTPRKPAGYISRSASGVSSLSDDPFAFSPVPSSGRVNSTFLTPPRDLRRLLYKSMTPPWAISAQP